MRLRGPAALATLLAALGACSSSAPTTARATSPVTARATSPVTAPATSSLPFAAHTTTLDGGALTIVSAPPQHTNLSRKQAEYDLAHSTLGGAGWSQTGVELGYVTVAPSAMQPAAAGDPPPAAPRHMLSWVLFYGAGSSSCPAQGPGAGATIPPGASRKLAMIVDAGNGSALGYAGIGSDSCDAGPARARVTKAGQRVSVPWTDAGGTYVLATFPPCVHPGEGTPGVSSASGTEFAVLGYRYFDTCHAKPQKVRVEVTFPRPWSHSPVGPVATGSSG